MEMERPRREDGQQQMDTQAHNVGPQRTWDDNGRDGLTNSKDLRIQKRERQSVVGRT